MSTSGTSSVTRYRPAILVLTGAAAAYTAYILYSVIQSTPPRSLHRSNAVRRRLRRRSGANVELSQTLAADARHPDLGDYDLFGTSVPLSTQNIVPVSELREIVTSSNPEASAETIEITIANVYDLFLDRLFDAVFPERWATSLETEAIRRWIGDQVPDATAVNRAAQRHSQRHPENGPVLDNLDLGDLESIAPTELSWGSDEDTEGDNADPDGQVLQRTLYHIAEDRARHEGVVHRGITCNSCDEKPIRGVRWHCANCVDFDLCSSCEATNSHYKTHIFYKVRIPAPYLSLPKQEPLYPGKFHMMSPSIDAVLKKDLVAETKMEAEEVEALWDQFTCLAGTEFTEDKSGVGWALDRRAFNHAFIPRYGGFTASPNLIYDRIFAYFDTDKNGLIGFNEWIKGLDGMHTTDVEIKARIVFDGYDFDGDGYVSRKDMLRILRAYYAVEKEATRNYIAELTDDLSFRGASDIVRSSQPLGSAFPPSSMSSPENGANSLCDKYSGTTELSRPLLDNEYPDLSDRQDVLLSSSSNDSPNHDVLEHRWSRRQYYVDEEEGMMPPNGAEASTAADLARHNGYEVPERERNIGKEVLYQITQQAFNELLDPLFQDKEDMAMDAFEARAERRKHIVEIELALAAFSKKKVHLSIIHAIGWFQYAAIMVQRFCEIFDGTRKANNDAALRNYLLDHDGTYLAYAEAKKKLASAYTELEDLVVAEHTDSQITKNEPKPKSLWDTWSFCQTIQDEILVATMECVHGKGWILESHPGRTDGDKPPSNHHVENFRDPTMPQFRPNSSDHKISRAENSSAADQETPSKTTDMLTESDNGPFLVLHAHGRNIVSNDTGAAYVNKSTTEAQVTSTRMLRSSTTERTNPVQGESSATQARVWTLRIDTIDGIEKLSWTTSLFMNVPNKSLAEACVLHTQALAKCIHRSALRVQSVSYVTRLAYLTVVELEISERKGSGLIDFEEFADHMRLGKLRFLESWMEWISI